MDMEWGRGQERVWGSEKVEESEESNMGRKHENDQTAQPGERPGEEWLHHENECLCWYGKCDIDYFTLCCLKCFTWSLVCGMVCVCVYTYECGYPQRPDKQVWATWLGCWELNCGPLKEQHLFLTAKPSSLPHKWGNLRPGEGHLLFKVIPVRKERKHDWMGASSETGPSNAVQEAGAQISDVKPSKYGFHLLKELRR